MTALTRYARWKMGMMFYLRFKPAWGIVAGLEQPPPATTSCRWYIPSLAALPLQRSIYRGMPDWGTGRGMFFSYAASYGPHLLPLIGGNINEGMVRKRLPQVLHG